MSFRTGLRWLRIGLEALAAAIIVLTLLQLHTGIIQYALTMTGLRTDVPLIVGLNDRCNRKFAPLVWDAGTDLLRDISCDDKVSVISTAPQGKEVTLFLNDQLVDTRRVVAPLVRFDDVPLRLGWNSLAVVEADADIDFPHPMLRQVWQFPGPQKRNFRETTWTKIPGTQAPNYISLQWAPKQDQLRRELKAYEKPVATAWFKLSGAERQSDVLAQGLPGAAIGADASQFNLLEQTLGEDGFSIAYLRGDKPPFDTRSQTIERELSIRDAEDEQIKLALSACLPADHPFVDWSRRTVMDTPELITRSTGYFLTSRVKAGDDRWRDKRRIEVVDQPDKGCVQLTASYEGRGEIGRYFSGTFLRLSGDKIVMDAALARRLLPSRLADSNDGEQMTWNGGPRSEFPPRFQRNQMIRETLFSSSGAPDANETEERSYSRAGLLDHWRELSNALPDLIRAMLWGLALMIPVALIYWALGAHRIHSPMPHRIDRARHGVLALLAFMAAMTLQPLLIEASRSVSDSARLWMVTFDEARGRFSGDSSAPLAFVVVLMIVPLLRAQELPGRRDGGLSRFLHFVGRLFLAAISIALLPLAFAVAVLARYIVSGEVSIPSDINILGVSSLPVVLGLLVMAWCVLGLLTFWIPVYWLARSLMPRGMLLGAAFTAAILMFFLPMITPATEAARELVAFGTSTYGDYGPGPAVLLTLAALSSLAGVVIIVTLTLRGFREIAAAMLNLPPDGKFQKWCRNSILFVAAVLIVGPATGALASPDVASYRAYQFLSTFQAYGGLLAFLALFAALRNIDEVQRNIDFATRFKTGESVLLLLTAAFAGYLSLWVSEPIGAPILAGIGGLVFYYGIIGQPVTTVEPPEPGLAERVLKYRAGRRLREARLKAFEKKFSNGGIDAAALATQRAAIDVEDSQAKQALGMPVETATFRILGFGPGSSPMSNALLGAVTGLVVAGLLQVILPIDFRMNSDQKAPSWMTLLQMFIVDPNYRPIGSGSSNSRVLSVISELINDTAIWVLIGFLFGYLFHRIRGNDGFAKAMVFAAGVSVTFLVGQALVARGGGVPVGNLARLMPIFVFLIFLGTLVFDGRSLRREGMPLAQLPDLYGLKTTIGYASFAGILAGVQPLLQALDWIFKR